MRAMSRFRYEADFKDLSLQAAPINEVKLTLESLVKEAFSAEEYKPKLSPGQRMSFNR